MARKLIGGQLSLNLALDDDAPNVAVVDHDVWQAAALGLIFGNGWVAGKGLLDDYKAPC